MKFLSVVLGVILIITALPLQILLHYYFFEKIALSSEGYAVCVYFAECIMFFSQALLGLFLITKIREGA